MHTTIHIAAKQCMTQDAPLVEHGQLRASLSVIPAACARCAWPMRWVI